MFNGIAIFANEFHRQVVYSLAVESRFLTLQRVTDTYPSPVELSSLIGAMLPVDVILIDLHDPERFLHALQILREHFPDTPAVGVGGSAAHYRSLAMAGIRHFLPFPLDPVSFYSTISQAIRDSHAQPIPHLYAFMPAKAGCGASTGVLAAATALGALGGSRTLCVDADLRSGCLALMLEARPSGSTQSVLAAAHELDRFRWGSAISSRFHVDFLFSSGERLSPLPDWSQYFALLQFSAARYGRILVDLPELVNPATEEILRRAGTVFVVVTEEAIPVRLAERRIAELLEVGIAEDRIHLLLNRASRSTAAAQIIAEGLGRPVAWRLPNDYAAIQHALRRGEWPLPERSDLGRAFRQFAQSLAEQGGSAAQASSIRVAKSGARLANLFRSLVASP